MSSILHGHVYIFRREKFLTKLILCEDITYLNLYEHLSACIFITYFRGMRIQFYCDQTLYLTSRMTSYIIKRFLTKHENHVSFLKL